MKMTRDEALAYLDRLITAKEIIEERHRVGDDVFSTVCEYGYDDPEIWVHRLGLIAEIAGYPVTVENWNRPEFQRVTMEYKGRKFCDLERREVNV